MTLPAIPIRDFDYPLPPERIAQFPADARDGSKLLICRDNLIGEDSFSHIVKYLPGESLLVFNDTRVIRARLLFERKSGSRIEIFCLEPESQMDLLHSFRLKGSATWRCYVGNRKRWKEEFLSKLFYHEGVEGSLTARLVESHSNGTFTVAFSWDPPALSFASILELSGLVPLPPYIQREADEADAARYQTLFATHDGSVAAPTAGLHFTEQLLKEIEAAGHITDRVTLHVGAGTFKPVVADTIDGHEMHSERISVMKSTVTALLAHAQRPVIAVGTTSARTLESLYWIGVNLAGNKPDPFTVEQWQPYQANPSLPTKDEALQLLLRHLDRHGEDRITGQTSLLIIPGYTYRIINGLITNFHMPQSTLLLLVAALIGDKWKEAYDHALAGNFRFLSYGDSCLFLKT